MNQGLNWIGAGVLAIGLLACGHKKKDTGETFFPALSFIQSQVAHVDTSLYFIRKIVSVDSLRSDTLYIRREAFRDEAKDFLSLPDLSASRYKDRYTENSQFDQSINRVLLTYTPADPEKEQIQREDVLIRRDPSGDKVTTIIIHSIVNTRDSLVEKRMLWQVDKSFQVTTMRQLPGQPEVVSTFKVIWNEDQ